MLLDGDLLGLTLGVLLLDGDLLGVELRVLVLLCVADGVIEDVADDESLDLVVLDIYGLNENIELGDLPLLADGIDALTLLE